MWQIIKTDATYNRLGLSIIFGAVIIFFLMTTVLGWLDIFGFSSITMMVFWIVMGILGASDDKEKGDRRALLLPFSMKALVKARLGLVVLLQHMIFITWLLALWITRPPDPVHTLKEIITMNALVINAVFLFVLFYDLKYMRHKRFLIIAIIITVLFFAGLITLGILGLIYYPLNFGGGRDRSWLEVLTFIFIGIGLGTIDYRVYLARDTYLH